MDSNTRNAIDMLEQLLKPGELYSNTEQEEHKQTAIIETDKTRTNPDSKFTERIIRPVNRVIIYIKGENDDWGDKDIVAIADIQVRFPLGSLSVIKGLKVIKTGPKSYGVVIPTVKLGIISVPVFKGRELMSIIESAVLGTFNKVLSEKYLPGEVWEQFKTGDEYYFGKARGEYGNAQYRK